MKARSTRTPTRIAVLVAALLVGAAAGIPTSMPAHSAGRSAQQDTSTRYGPGPLTGRFTIAQRFRDREVADVHGSAPPNQAATSTVQTRTQMLLPASAFPSDFSQRESHSIDAADADDTSFAQLHKSKYADLGMLGGWWQYYSKDLSDGLFDIVYQGSYYSTTTAARAAFDDIAGNLGYVGETSSCSFGDECIQAKATITFQDGQYRGIIRVVLRSNAVAEFSSVVPSAEVGALQDTLLRYLDNAAHAFLTIFSQPQATETSIPPTPTNTPLPPTATPTATATPTPVVLTLSVRGVPRVGHTGTIQATVRDSTTHQAVIDAKVTLDGRNAGLPRIRHATTTARGTATFRQVRPTHAGAIKVTVSKQGFVGGATSVQVRP